MGNKYAEPGCSELSNKCNQTETGHSEMVMGIVIETGMMLIKLSAV